MMHKHSSTEEKKNQQCNKKIAVIGSGPTGVNTALCLVDEHRKKLSQTLESYTLDNPPPLLHIYLIERGNDVGYEMKSNW